MMKLEALLQEIRHQGIEVSAEDIADALWLFALVRPMPAQKGFSKPKAGDEAPGDVLDASDDSHPKAAHSDKGGSQAVNLPRSAAPLFAPSGDRSGEGARRGSPVLIPGAREAGNGRALVRALRPLIGRTPSKSKKSIDILATAERIAELKCAERHGLSLPWWPVMRRATEPKLDLALVIDESASMRVWDNAAIQLQQIFFSLGAFRDKRIWKLDSSRIENPYLSCAALSAPRRPLELTDPSGRRLILILTDCHGASWYGSKLKEVLFSWARSQPVTIVQMLPERLWLRTALATAAKIWVPSVRPGPARRGTGEPSNPPLPLLGLVTMEFRQWALCAASRQGAETRAALFECDLKIAKSIPERSYRGFMRRGSTKAKDLARLFAEVTPARLPILRLIQQVMLPDSDAGDLSELILDGLLAAPEGNSILPEFAEYDIDALVKEKLREDIDLDIADKNHVHRLLSHFLSYAANSRTSVRVVVAARDGSLQIPDVQQPIAELSNLGPVGTLPTSLSPDTVTLQLPPANVAERPLDPGQPYESERLRAELVGTKEGGPRRGVRMLTVLTSLTRLAQRRPQTEKELRNVLAGRINEVAEVALEVGAEIGDPIGRVLAEYVAEMPLSLVERLYRKLQEPPYREAIPLWEIGLEATRLLLLERLAKANTTGANGERARLRLNLGQRLRKLGRLEESLNEIQHAVDDFRRVSSNEATDRLDLAEALTDISLVFLGLGQMREALAASSEAVEMARLSASRPQLALTLLSLASILNQFFRFDESLIAGAESIRLSRLSAREEQEADNLNLLAEALITQSRTLLAVDQRMQALELATEATKILEELAAAVPVRHQLPLALALDVLAQGQEVAGRLAEALSSSEGAIAIFRQLAFARPSAFLGDLGRCLVNAGRIQAAEQPERALNSLKEGIAIFRRLAQSRPAAFLGDLARCLETSARFQAAEQPEMALLSLNEAIAIFQQLDQERPNAYSRELAAALAFRTILDTLMEAAVSKKIVSTRGSTEEPGTPEADSDGLKREELIGIPNTSGLILDVAIVDQVIRFEFQHGSQFLRFEKKLSRRAREIAKERFDNFSDRGSHGDSLARLGFELSEHLLPSALANRLVKSYEKSRDVQSGVQTLWVISDEPWIPWEYCCFDDEERKVQVFLGEMFALSYWSYDIEANLSFPIRRLALVSGTNFGELGMETEGRMINALFRDGTREVLEIGASTIGVRSAMTANQFDAWHFICYGARNSDSPELSYLILEREGETLSASDLGMAGNSLRAIKPLIFLNSSYSASMAQSFIKAGAGAVIGYRGALADALAAKFSESFYRHFFGGRPIGESVFQARLQLQQDFPGNPTWLGYSVFAEPNASQKAADAVVPARRRDGKFLSLPWQVWRSELSPPGSLLRADHGVVPFYGREPELSDLEAWCRDFRAIGVRLYTSPGGMGKTRLALEACRLMRLEGWRTGFVGSAADRFPQETIYELTNAKGPLLAVIDYAETRRGLLVPLLRELVSSNSGEKVRVILLARWREEWWDQLKGEGELVGDLIGGPATMHLVLRPLASSPEDRRRVFLLAAKAFAEVLQKPAPQEFPETIDEKHFEPVLMIQMAALGAVDGVSLKDEDGILDWILNREKRFWKTQFVERGLPDNLLPGIARAMCAITLGGGVRDQKGTVALLEALKSFNGQPRTVIENVARLLHDTYPGERWVMPLQPDLLGEHLLEGELTEDPQEIFELVLEPKIEDRS